VERGRDAVTGARLRSGWLAWFRFGGGLACVLVAAGVFFNHAPAAYRDFNANVTANSWRNTLDRLVAPGDITGLDKGFQEAALSILPADARYTVIGPPTPEIGLKNYGMNDITQAGLVPFLRYLLLPARQVAPEAAQYVLCYGCDTTPWAHNATWLWRNENGDLIGRVNGR
jgi:hypothetical protein